VLISRCAWHPRYYGYSKLLGVSDWRGLQVNFTDGICPKCAARVRIPRRPASAGRSPAVRGGHDSQVAAVALAVLTGLVLAARPANEASTHVVEVADRLPGTLTVAQAPPVRQLAASARELRPPALGPDRLERREPAAFERLQSP
jgi:hypothetical protein